MRPPTREFCGRGRHLAGSGPGAAIWPDRGQGPPKKHSFVRSVSRDRRLHSQLLIRRLATHHRIDMIAESTFVPPSAASTALVATKHSAWSTAPARSRAFEWRQVVSRRRNAGAVLVLCRGCGSWIAYSPARVPWRRYSRSRPPQTPGETTMSTTKKQTTLTAPPKTSASNPKSPLPAPCSPPPSTDPTGGSGGSQRP